MTVHVPSRSSRAEERLRRVSTDPAQDVSQDLARGGRIGIAPALEFAITAVIPAGLATRNYAGKSLLSPTRQEQHCATFGIVRLRLQVIVREEAHRFASTADACAFELVRLAIRFTRQTLVERQIRLAGS